MYKVGDIILQRCYTGGTRLVLVTTQEREIKNGRAGFGGTKVEEDGTEIKSEFGSGVWGYDDQVVKVVKRGTRYGLASYLSW